MDKNGSFTITDELKKRAEELAKNTYQNEIDRINELIKKADEFSEMRNREFWEKCEAKLKSAEKIFQESVQFLNEREKEIEQILKQERIKKLDAYRKQIEEKKLKEEEERRRIEEEKRRREEEERRRLEEEQRLKEELQRRREEEERLRKEEEIRRKKEEIEQKVQTLLMQAKEYFEQENYESALIEVAKALVHNSEHPEALELKQKIKQAQGKTTQVEEPIKVEEKTVAPETTEPPVEVTPIISKIPKKKSKKLKYAALILVTIVLFAIIIYNYLPKLFYKPSSLAVLPFKSETNTLEEDNLGKGLAEDVVNRLNYIKDLQLMGFRSALFISNYYNDPSAIIHQVGFDKALVGKLRITDEKVIVKLSIKDTTGENFSSEIFCDKGKIYELPSRISKEIVKMLKIKKENVNETAFKISTVDNSAYLIYLRAIEMLHRRTEESINNAQQLFDFATSQDDSFIEAFAMSGYASVLKLEYNYDNSNDNIEKATMMLEKADIKSQNQLFVKPKIMLLDLYKKNFTEVERKRGYFESLGYSNPEIFYVIGKFNIFTGNYNEAVNALTKLQKLDPYNFDVLRLLIKAYQLNKDYKSAYSLYNQYNAFFDDTSQAVVDDLSNIILNDPELMVKYSNWIIGTLERRLEKNPRDFIDRYKLARIYQVNGKYFDAEPILIKALDLNQAEYIKNPTNPELLIYRALINTRLGRFNDAIKSAQDALKYSNNNHKIYYKVAQMYAIQAGGNDTLYYDKKSHRPVMKEFINSIELLQKGIDIFFDLDEILDIDFYNVRRTNEFQEAIRIKGK